ncbi:uncharacterized protein LOC124915714 isoform X2 [Impatiens glandulifera]|nr:uncharacterized protein LOC124915714 isoform X2 [Impatiens glandulifera]
MQMLTVTRSQASFSKSSQVQIRSFSSCTTRSKIFEDESQGIVCYKDELTGETICEGCDEGPRCCPTEDINSLTQEFEKSDVKKKKKLIQIVVNGDACGEGGGIITREFDYNTVVNWMDFKSLP